MSTYRQIDERLIPIKQYVTPVTGATVLVNSNGFVRLIINPAGSLISLTVTLPSSPTDGDTVVLGSTQAVTTLTMNGGTIIGGLTTLAVGSTATFVYSSDAVEWVKMSS